MMVFLLAAVSLQGLAGAELNHDGVSQRAQFVMPRLRLAYEHAPALIEIEAVRSLKNASLFGVAGDSQLLRLRRAELRHGVKDIWMIRAGLVQLPWLVASDRAWVWSDAQPHGWADQRVLDATDLGVSMEACLGQAACAQVAVVNGEGADQRELNSSPSYHVVAHADIRSLRLSIGGVVGERGVSRALDQRAMGMAQWRTKTYSAFASLIRGWGRGDDGSIEWGLIESGGSARFGLQEIGARFSWARESLADSERWSMISSALIERRLSDQLKARLWFDHKQLGRASEAADPGQWLWRTGLGLSLRHKAL